MDERIAAVQRMQDYIEENINGKITMEGLAHASMFSPWYSYRLFKEYTGLTPSDYIRRLRLSQSAMLLKNGVFNVTEAAFDCGFGSVDGYQRAFFREFGCNPGQYAEKAVPLTLFIPYGVKFRNLRRDKIDMENLRNVFIQVLHKPERKVIIKRGVSAENYFPYCEEVGCDVWGLLCSMVSSDGEPVSMWLPKKYVPQGTSVYVQGVEVSADYNGTVPDGFDVILLPAADYLMFQGEPYNDEDYCEAIRAVQCAMDRYDPEVIGRRWNDESPRIQLEPRAQRGYIEMRAVTEKR